MYVLKSAECLFEDFFLDKVTKYDNKIVTIEIQHIDKHVFLQTENLLRVLGSLNSGLVMPYLWNS